MNGTQVVLRVEQHTFNDKVKFYRYSFNKIIGDNSIWIRKKRTEIYDSRFHREYNLNAFLKSETRLGRKITKDNFENVYTFNWRMEK